MKKGVTFLIVLLVGCTGTKNNPKKEPPTLGKFYQNSTLHLEDRIQIQKGNDVTATFERASYSGPEGADDGDGGEVFYVQFLKPEEIHDGITLDIKDSSILVYIARWASPAAYTIIPQDNLEGKIEVTVYEESRIKMNVTIGKLTSSVHFAKGTLP